MSLPAAGRLEVVSDAICPWCWIGKHRLQAALEGMGPVDIHWHPYQLDPDADATPVPLRCQSSPPRCLWEK